MTCFGPCFFASASPVPFCTQDLGNAYHDHVDRTEQRKRVTMDNIVFGFTLMNVAIAVHSTILST